MKIIFAAIMMIAPLGSMSFAEAAPAKICGNGWAAFASCAKDTEHYVHLCLDPSRNDGAAVVHTLDVASGKITEEVGVAYVSSRNQVIVVETNSPTFKNLTIQRLTAKAAGGERAYRPGVQGKSDDLNSFFCKIDDTYASKIPTK